MMIACKDLYYILSAVVPLYLTMFLAYVSVKWWKVFTPEQCAGINRFVAIFAVPFLSFEFISRINPFRMNALFVAADAVSKILVLCFLFTWAKFSPGGSLDWSITLFSLSALPNTLVMGIPLLKSMYGDDEEGLMIQVVVLQTIIWYTLLLFLFEYREARSAITQEQRGTFAPAAPLSVGAFFTPSRDRACDNNRSIEFQRPKGSEVVHVIVANCSSESDQQKPQISSKVVPDSRQLPTEEEFVSPFFCCNSQGPRERSLAQVLRGEEDTKKKQQKQNDQEERQGDVEDGGDERIAAESGMITLILRMVWSKLIRNPNSYASLLGLSWALVSNRWNVRKPLIVDNSVTILSNAGLGMAMFSLGLFMALQPSIVACGKKTAAYGMAIRFLVGPAAMAVASLVVGINGTTLKVSIVQAALPLGLVPFVFAREYNLHPEVLSTAVIFGMIVSLPVTVLYYVFLGL